MDALLAAVSLTCHGETPKGPQAGRVYGDWACHSVWYLRPGALCRFAEMQGPGVRYVLCRVDEEPTDVTGAVEALLSAAVGHDCSKLAPGFYSLEFPRAD